MGPLLLLDRYTLQSLSDEEMWSIYRYYLAVNVPVQFIDILQQKEKDTLTEVVRKLHLMDSDWTVHYRISIAHNLLERDHPDRLPSRIDAILTGRKNLPFGIHPEKEALRLWKADELTIAKQLLSERWRSTTRAIDLGNKLRKGYNFPAVTSFAELKSATLAFCDTPDPQQQAANFEFLLDEADLGNISEPIRNRWFECGRPPLKKFAPYAYYCLTVFAAFYTAIANGLIDTRTSRVALEYLLYLPFCEVFSSNDPFHKQFVPIFLGDMKRKQDFVDNATLKQDLKRIYAYWNSVPEVECEAYQEKFGNYPPALTDSITSQLWEKHIRPRTERKRGQKGSNEILADCHKAFPDTPEEKELIHEINEVIAEVRRAST